MTADLSRPPEASGPSPRSWPEATVEALKGLWVEGDLTAAEIARQLGVSRNAVLGKVHRLGLSRSRPERAHASKEARPERRGQGVPRPRPAAASPPRRQGGGASALHLPGLVPRLEHLGAQACHWPIGDPKAADFAFCGRAAGGRVYCAAHWAVAHQPGRTAA
jgi:GcrA cell cycle regulator